MKLKKKVIYSVIIILVVGGVQLFRLYRQPLGPALDLPTSTQRKTQIPPSPHSPLKRTLPIAQQLFKQLPPPNRYAAVLR